MSGLSAFLDEHDAYMTRAKKLIAEQRVRDLEAALRDLVHQHDFFRQRGSHLRDAVDRARALLESK